MKAWLRERPREEALAFLYRDALEVLPFWGAAMNDDWAKKKGLTALPILRAVLTLFVGMNFSDMEKWLSKALDVAGSAANSTSTRASDDEMTPSRSAASEAAQTIHNALGLVCSSQHPLSEDNDWVAGIGRQYENRIQGFATAASVLAKGSLSGLIRSSFLRPPDTFVRAEKLMFAVWDEEPSARWDFWRRWWEGAKNGDPIDPELQYAIVQGLDEETWKDPDAVAKRIKEIEIRHRSGYPPETGRAARRKSSDVQDVARQIDIQDERLSELLARLNAQEALLAERDERLNEAGKAVESVSNQALSLREKLDAQKSDFDKEFRTLSAAYDEKFESALSAFMEQQAIKAPVELWEIKETEHRTAAKGAFWSFVGGLIAIGLLVVGIVWCLISGGDELAKLLAPIGCDPVAAPALCGGFSFRGAVLTGAVLSFVTLALWFTRLRMKVYLSERHLSLDARERKAFAQAYIGLIKEKDTSDEAREQRALVYAALFRPSTDGIIAEDGGLDPSLAAAVSKLLAGR
ncbi:DUF6161 domain-containing protein [Primorskyibacter sp. 2E107]|uniref:DUF6161 domain-containing protein n=1 Tax=Primorskyibacter sp. 2E107 TaxID=3403458 RepID=UPI003AF5319C